MTGIDSTHKQTWVKVNAQVDEGIAEIVTILSQVEDLETIESCQGRPAANPQEGVEPMAYVYFYLGNWQTLGRFAFGTIAPAIKEIERASIMIEIVGRCEPRGRLAASTPSLQSLAVALSAAVSRHNSLYSHDMERTGPRSC